MYTFTVLRLFNQLIVVELIDYKISDIADISKSCSIFFSAVKYDHLKSLLRKRGINFPLLAISSSSLIWFQLSA